MRLISIGLESVEIILLELSDLMFGSLARIISAALQPLHRTGNSKAKFRIRKESREISMPIIAI